MQYSDGLLLSHLVLGAKKSCLLSWDSSETGLQQGCAPCLRNMYNPWGKIETSAMHIKHSGITSAAAKYEAGLPYLV